MKLLLTSAGLKDELVRRSFILNLPKNIASCSVLMVAYAQSAQEQVYVDESKHELMQLGLNNITVFDLHQEEFSQRGNYDVIYVCGGNTYDYLERIRLCGLQEFIQTAVRQHDALYVGVSAGSIIAGPSIDIAGWGSEADVNNAGLVDLTGLGLTDIAIFPHFQPHLRSEVDAFKQRVSYRVVELTDQQALLITDSGSEMISSK